MQAELWAGADALAEIAACIDGLHSAANQLPAATDWRSVERERILSCRVPKPGRTRVGTPSLRFGGPVLVWLPGGFAPRSLFLPHPLWPAGDHLPPPAWAASRRCACVSRSFAPPAARWPAALVVWPPLVRPSRCGWLVEAIALGGWSVLLPQARLRFTSVVEGERCAHTSKVVGYHRFFVLPQPILNPEQSIILPPPLFLRSGQ